MSRYTLQEKVDDEWIDMDGKFSTKKELDNYIGNYGTDFDWRSGFTFKKYNNPNVERFVVTNTGDVAKP